MRQRNYNKLVRDRIPEIIAANGETPKIRTLTDEEFSKALAAKLVEEAKEAEAAIGDTSELVKELGDVLEVIDAMVAHFGLDRSEIERVKAKRNAERGGFLQRLLLERVEE